MKGAAPALPSASRTEGVPRGLLLPGAGAGRGRGRGRLCQRFPSQLCWETFSQRGGTKGFPERELNPSNLFTAMPAPSFPCPSLSPALPCSQLLTLCLEITPLSRLEPSHLQVDLLDFSGNFTPDRHPGVTRALAPVSLLGFGVYRAVDIGGNQM